MRAATKALTQALPPELIATRPPETRGVPRDRVRMLVATADGLAHHTAADLPRVLRAGDLLVLNTSDTLPAALTGVTSGRERVEVHLSTLDPAAGQTYPAALAATASHWLVEVRTPGPPGGEPSPANRAGTSIRLTGGGLVELGSSAPEGLAVSRLWRGRLHTPQPLGHWLAEHGAPIRYHYVTASWPLSFYRTEHADTPGSAEMPSAGRPLTRRLLRRLAVRGVQVAPVVLHTGVSSADAGEPPYDEWFSVPVATARAVREARAEGRRVIAVGTTVVRALESAVDGTGTVRPAAGWTGLVITPRRGVATVDGLLTGWHEPRASHLLMLGAIAGEELLGASYAEARRAGYRWHEFGDLHLIVPGHSR
ncbi:MAG TPA: S-adenosylmethionine:tRNA ribosyltransferase-isomerase [Pseudonocardiaceae bacterium]|jgi:S-adenosylmethionine:tRNA ribosyltransferase-isomerase